MVLNTEIADLRPIAGPLMALSTGTIDDMVGGHRVAHLPTAEGAQIPDLWHPVAVKLWIVRPVVLVLTDGE